MTMCDQQSQADDDFDAPGKQKIMACVSRGLCISKISIWFIKVNVRGFARYAHRNPIKIFSSEEAKKLSNKPSLIFEDSISDVPAPSEKEQARPKNFAAEQPSRTANKYDKKKDAVLIEKRTTNISKPHVIDAKKKRDTSHNVKDQITIIACGEPVVQDIVTDKQTSERKLSSVIQTVKSSRARKAYGKILLEGERLIADAMNAGAHAETIFFSDTKLLTTLPLKKYPSIQLYQVQYGKIQLWSDLTTSPGIMGIFDVTKPTNSDMPHHIPLTIICDNIRDPGNMGTIIRCAAAVGCKALITTPDCVDVWDSKVLRAASGAHFRIKLALSVDWDLIAENFITQDDTVLLADSSIQATSPIVDEKDRLASNLSWIEREQGPKSRSVEILKEGNIQYRDSSYLDDKSLRVYKKLPLPHSVYDKIDLNSVTSLTLVIGGETHGLSSAAHKLAHEYGGSKVFIPLENKVDSLNAGVAVGILAYEFRRSFLQKKVSESQKM